MPIEANEIIRFINSKNKEDLENLKIEDRMETILEVRRVMTKKGLMLQLEEKSQIMESRVQRFFSKIEALQKKGLLGLLVLNDKLMTYFPTTSKRFPWWQRTTPNSQGYKEA
jgi:hypothetical protein